jgi:hypothetical protein
MHFLIFFDVIGNSISASISAASVPVESAEKVVESAPAAPARDAPAALARDGCPWRRMKMPSSLQKPRIPHWTFLFCRHMPNVKTFNENSEYQSYKNYLKFFSIKIL